MDLCLYWKHADVITVHTSMVEFVHDYQDVIDNRGLEAWYEPGAAAYAVQTEGHNGYATYAQQNREIA